MLTKQRNLRYLPIVIIVMSGSHNKIRYNLELPGKAGAATMDSVVEAGRRILQHDSLHMRQCANIAEPGHCMHRCLFPMKRELFGVPTFSQKGNIDDNDDGDNDEDWA